MGKYRMNSRPLRPAAGFRSSSSVTAGRSESHARFIASICWRSDPRSNPRVRELSSSRGSSNAAGKYSLRLPSGLTFRFAIPSSEMDRTNVRRLPAATRGANPIPSTPTYRSRNCSPETNARNSLKLISGLAASNAAAACVTPTTVSSCTCVTRCTASVSAWNAFAVATSCRVAIVVTAVAVSTQPRTSTVNGTHCWRYGRRRIGPEKLDAMADLTGTMSVIGAPRGLQYRSELIDTQVLSTRPQPLDPSVLTGRLQAVG